MAKRNFGNLYGGKDALEKRREYQQFVEQTQRGYKRAKNAVLNNPVSQGIKSTFETAGEFVDPLRPKEPPRRPVPEPTTIFDAPLHGWVRNCSTGEEMIWPINPETLEMNYEVEETEQAGFTTVFSNDYKGTRLPTFTMEFWVTRRRMFEIYGDQTKYYDQSGVKEIADDMEAFRNFFLALCFPDTAFQREGYIGAQPPFCEVNWPTLFLKTCRVKKVSNFFTLFCQDLSERIYACRVTFREDNLGQRLWSEDVRIHGLNGMVFP